LGYSPGWLSKTVAKNWIPVYISVVVIAIIITSVMHFLFVKISFVERDDLSYFLHWSVFVVGLLLLILSIFTNYRLIKKELYKIV
jgi:amino acid transporter